MIDHSSKRWEGGGSNPTVVYNSVGRNQEAWLKKTDGVYVVCSMYVFVCSLERRMSSITSASYK